MLFLLLFDGVPSFLFLFFFFFLSFLFRSINSKLILILLGIGIRWVKAGKFPLLFDDRASVLLLLLLVCQFKTDDDSSGYRNTLDESGFLEWSVAMKRS